MNALSDQEKSVSVAIEEVTPKLAEKVYTLHIAIISKMLLFDNKAVDWMKNVSDEQYQI